MLKGGRSLERSVSLRSGAQVAGRAPAPRPRGRRDRRRAASSCAQLLRSCGAGRRVHRVARPRRRGRDRAGAARGDRPAVHGLGAGGVRALHDKVLAKQLMREAGIPTPDFHPLQRDLDQGARGGAALATSSAELGFPLVVKPASQALGAGRQVRALERGAARRARRRVLLRPQGPARALRRGPRPGRLGARLRATAGTARRPRRSRCRSSRRCRARRPSTTTSRAMRSA